MLSVVALGLIQASMVAVALEPKDTDVVTWSFVPSKSRLLPKLGQLSLIVGAIKVVVPVHSPVVVFTVTGPVQVIVGAWLSTTVTVNEQVAAGEQVLVAVTTTFVTPLLNDEPLPVPLPEPMVAPVKA